MLNTIALSHDYRGSGLPRRSFHVDIDLPFNDREASHRAYAVTAPDPLRAEQIVRSHLRRQNVLFSIVLIREISEAYVPGSERPGIVITVPGWFEHAL